jgi:LemA protein
MVKNMELIYVLLIIIIFISLLGIFYALCYNKLQDCKLKIDEAEEIIDENLRKKYDTIIDIKNIIENEIKDDKINFKEFEKVKNDKISNFDMDRKLNEFMNLIEKIKNDYSELKKNKDLNEFFKDIKKINEKIDSAKGFYNKYITESNKLIRKFPSNIIAKIHGVKIKPFFDNKNMNDNIIRDFKL